MAGEACCSCETIDQMLREHIEALIDVIEKSLAAPKKAKRRPSAYNMFVKECTLGGANDLKSCAAKYKDLPPAEKTRFQEMAKSAS